METAAETSVCGIFRCVRPEDDGLGGLMAGMVFFGVVFIELFRIYSKFFRQSMDDYQLFEFFRQGLFGCGCRRSLYSSRMAERKAAAVSMVPDMFEEAKARAQALGFSTFSSYVVQLLRKDLSSRGRMVLEEDVQPLPPPPPVKTNRRVNYRDKIKPKK